MALVGRGAFVDVFLPGRIALRVALAGGSFLRIRGAFLRALAVNGFRLGILAGGDVGLLPGIGGRLRKPALPLRGGVLRLGRPCVLLHHERHFPGRIGFRLRLVRCGRGVFRPALRLDGDQGHMVATVGNESEPYILHTFHPRNFRNTLTDLLAEMIGS